MKHKHTVWSNRAPDYIFGEVFCKERIKYNFISTLRVQINVQVQIIVWGGSFWKIDKRRVQINVRGIQIFRYESCFQIFKNIDYSWLWDSIDLQGILQKMIIGKFALLSTTLDFIHL